MWHIKAKKRRKRLKRKKKKEKEKMEQKHLYHLVDPSPWPILTATSAMGMLIGGVMYMHSIENGLFVLFIGFLSTLFVAGLWWRDVIREATFEGQHTLVVQKGLRYGMLLFILSEVMFFL